MFYSASTDIISLHQTTYNEDGCYRILQSHCTKEDLEDIKGGIELQNNMGLIHITYSQYIGKYCMCN